MGPLATIERLDDTFLAMNGDVLTTLDYARFVDLHRESGNVLTVASHRRHGSRPTTESSTSAIPRETKVVTGFEEKPEIGYVVSMGIYAMEPQALDFIDPGEYMDLPDLVLRLIEEGEQVGAHLFEGFWLDIGRHDDYERAIKEYEQLKPLLLPDHADLLAPAGVPA